MENLWRYFLESSLDIEIFEEGVRRCSSRLRENGVNFCECVCVVFDREQEGEKEIDLEVTFTWKYEIGCMENQHAKIRWL